MRGLTHAATAWLALLVVGAAHGGDSSVPVEPVATALPQIVVLFSNQPHTAPGPAGSTGSRYDGGGYGVTQRTLRAARRIAETYALRTVSSWPIELLSVDCVVFELTNGRPVSEVLAALSKEKGVVLAQPLNEFRAPGVMHMPDLRPGVPRAPPGRFIAPHSNRRPYGES